MIGTIAGLRVFGRTKYGREINPSGADNDKDAKLIESPTVIPAQLTYG
ncbi:hypothetical protein [Desertivirga arenae]|nr:hypothetical protein [Pedobacter sp. SYSU D00823]